MKRLLMTMLALSAMVIMLTACSHYYRVTTHDGQVYTADGKPQLDEDTKVYDFKLLDGKKVVLNQKDVKEIKQED